MTKRLSLLFVACSLTTLEATRSALRDDEEAMHEEGKAPKKVKKVQVVATNTPTVQKSCSKKAGISCEKQKAVVASAKSKQVKKTTDTGVFNGCFSSLSEKEEFSKILYIDVAAGFLKYLMPTSDIVRPGGNAAILKLDHAQLAPLVRAGIGLELTGLRCLYDSEKTTRARVGLQVLFAKRTNALSFLYTTTDSTTPNLRAIQSIERGEFMGVFNYDIIREFFSIEGGLGLVAGAVKKLSLYEPGPGYDDNFKPYGQPSLISIGQTLKPNGGAFGGFIGFTLEHRFECLNDTRCEFGYRSVFSTTSYKTRVYQTAPSSLASAAYQNAYALVQANGPIVLPQSPKVKIRAQEITFAAIFEF